MDAIHITLPDGKVQEVPKGTTPADIAKKISPRLADAALVARVAEPNDGAGELVDLRRPLDHDVKLQILTEKDPDALFVFRHSAAHLLAAAVMELYPNVKLGIGPPVDTGFFYEFLREEPFTPGDLANIEKKMHELAAQDLPNERKLIPKPEAIDLYKKTNQVFKCELVEEKAEDPMVSFYTTGKFIDFCRGPHIPSTKRIQAFKLMSVAGAYWKGQEGNPQLQRIYAACFFTQKELDEYLHRLEEAKRRDHRKLGAELDLFSIEEEAGPGLIFWHPKGGLIRTIVEDWLRHELQKRGYDLVYTPHIMRRELWNTSGHTGFYKDNMFGPVEVEKADYQLKPMNCPGHILIYKSKMRSYRDLPVRLAELGTVYRYERSGVLHGLMRVRGFTQDDAHIFCMPSQIESEVEACVDFAFAVMKNFGFDKFEVELSGLGRRASRKLRRQARRLAPRHRRARRHHAAHEHPLQAHRRRSRLLRPQDRRQAHRRHRPLLAAHHRAVRFQSSRALWPRIRRRRRRAPSAADGPSRPARLRRAILRHPGRALRRRVSAVACPGAGGNLPGQRKSDRLRASHVTETLKRHNVRVHLDDRNEKLPAKIRDAQLQKIPYMLIVGAKEAEAGTVSVRHRSKGDLGPKPLAEFLAALQQEIESRATS